MKLTVTAKMTEMAAARTVKRAKTLARDVQPTRDHRFDRGVAHERFVRDMGL